MRSGLLTVLAVAGCGLVLSACGAATHSPMVASTTPSAVQTTASAKVLPHWSRPTVLQIEAAMTQPGEGASLSTGQVHCIAETLYHSDVSDQELTAFAERKVDALTVADKAASNQIGYRMYECLLPHLTPTPGSSPSD